MDADTQEVLHKPMEQGYFKLNKPKLTLVVDNTKRKPIKRIGYDAYLDKNLKDFFEFLFGYFHFSEILLLTFLSALNISPTARRSSSTAQSKSTNA